jgi:streptogramin lyase
MVDERRRFTKIIFDEKTGTKYSCAVIIESKSLGIILYTSSGHYRFDETNKKLEHLKWSTEAQFSIGWRDNSPFDENRYIQTGYGKLVILDYAKKKKTFEFTLPNLVSACGINKEEILAAIDKGKLARINISQNKIVKEYALTVTKNNRLLNANAVKLRQAANGQVVITTTLGGLFIFDPETEKFSQYIHSPLDEFSISEDGKEAITCDDKGNVFVYGGMGGLDYFNIKNAATTYIPAFKGKGNELYMGGFNCIEKDRKGRLWMGSSEALVMYNPGTQQSAVYRYNYPVAKSDNRPLAIHSICIDTKDRVWVGTAGGGLGRLNEATGEFTKMSMDSLDGKPPRFPSNFVFTITEAGQDSLWIGCSKGFYIVNGTTFRLDSLHPAMKFKKDVDPAVMKIVKDSKGRVWIGCWGNGIFYYDRHTKELKEVKYANWKIPDVVNSFREVNGIMYTGSANGLSMINENGEQVLIPAKEGKYYAGVSSLTPAATGEIWFFSKNLIGSYNTVTKQFTTHDLEVRNDVFGFGSGVAFTDSTQYWCAEKGLVYLNSRQAIVSREGLKPIVYSVSAKDSVYDFLADEQISLTNKQNTLSFFFTSPKLFGSKSILFQYRLDGVDNDWVNSSGSRQVRYNSLAPGKYTFRCRVSLDNLTWSEDSNTILIIIRPSLWQRWWFRSLLVIVVAGATYYLFRRRVAAIREKEKVKAAYEKKIAEVEMSSLRAQMNPHFMFNSLNSINNFILKNDPENASGYLTKFSRLMRLILENSRSEWVPLENELKALELYAELESLRFKNRFEYTIHVENNVDVTSTWVPPMIIQPYVENAIWHGLLHRKEPGSKLNIHVWKTNGIINIEIEDNGIGREEAAARKSKTALTQKSHGMEITAQRLDIVNSLYNVNAKVKVTDIKDSGGKPAGTHVLLTLNDKTNDSHHSR